MNRFILRPFGDTAMHPANDPALRSFIDVGPDSHFPIQNWPFGVFRRQPQEPARVGVAIGAFVLDLSALARERLLDCNSLPGDFFLHQRDLNDFMARGAPAW